MMLSIRKFCHLQSLGNISEAMLGDLHIGESETKTCKEGTGYNGLDG